MSYVGPGRTLAEAAFQNNVNDCLDSAFVSATHVLPHVFCIIEPRSVVDVGCGGGGWLAACAALGVRDILGIDGDYVDVRRLRFPKEHFRAHDLTKPFEINRKFDLAISLEVAEHIPEQFAESFVASLVRLAPVVLFSAAIPFQRGVGHVNERWPSYWRQLFRAHDYSMVDIIRGMVWENNNVDVWYRQNVLLFVDKSYLASNVALAAAEQQANGRPVDVVHPLRYLDDANPTALRALKVLLKRSPYARLHWRLQRLIYYLAR
jgi:SAM-dependent methyltransferase